MRCGRGGEERLAERGCDSKGFWPENWKERLSSTKVRKDCWHKSFGGKISSVLNMINLRFLLNV